MYVCMYVHEYEGTIAILVWAIEINCDQCIKQCILYKLTPYYNRFSYYEYITTSVGVG